MSWLNDDELPPLDAGAMLLALRNELAAERAEVARLRSMLEWCWECAADGDIWGDDFEAQMEHVGLAVRRDDDEVVLAWHPLAANKEVGNENGT